MPLLNASRKGVCEGLQVANVVRVASEPVTSSIRSNWMKKANLKIYRVILRSYPT
jgi:hypothetical protein